MRDQLMETVQQLHENKSEGFSTVCEKLFQFPTFTYRDVRASSIPIVGFAFTSQGHLLYTCSIRETLFWSPLPFQAGEHNNKTSVSGSSVTVLGD